MTSLDSSEQKLPRALWSLLFGNFVIGTGIMVVPGTLNEISQSLQVSVATAGQLISAAALMVCIGAPLFATLIGNWDRRRLLALCMVWYGVLLVLCATMQSFRALLPVRVLAVIPAAIFTPQAAACVGLLVSPAQRGRAITLVFLGWSVASVLGMPVAAWIGGTLGWRTAFVLIGLMAFASAAWVWLALPNGIKPPALSKESWGATFRSRALMLSIAVTTLYSAGQFVLFAYLAPYYRIVLHVTPTELSLLFAWFGLFGFLGNMLASRNIDRLGPPRTVLICVGSMALSLLLWPLATTVALTALICVPWALGCFSSNSAQQARLVSLHPNLAGGSIALNTSAMYAGQGMGAASGGWLISQGQMGALHWYGFAGLVCAMAVSVWATRAQKAEHF